MFDIFIITDIIVVKKSLKILRKCFRGVEYVMLNPHTDDSVRFTLFPYFFELPLILPFTSNL